MMHIEDGVTRTGVNIITRIPAQGKMASAMNARETLKRMASVDISRLGLLPP